MNTTIKNYIDALDIETISEERRAILNPFKAYLASKIETEQPIAINYICTHNSRRSHLGQVWGQTMASYFGIDKVITYSGGTEATAVYKSVISTLKNIGFEIEIVEERDNPIYAISYDEDTDSVIAFSKKYEDDFNPSSDFIAIMTCSSADEGCPIVHGCEKRFAITYIDPKVSDNSPQEADTYAERCKQIATEMKYVFCK